MRAFGNADGEQHGKTARERELEAHIRALERALHLARGVVARCEEMSRQSLTYMDNALSRK